MSTEQLDRALAQFKALEFCERHDGHKESKSPRSFEYLLRCVCGSDRLRWRHEPGVKQAWVCWGCQKSGDTIALVQLLENVSEMDAIGYVVDGYVGGDAPTELHRTAVIAKPSPVHLAHLPRISYPESFERLDWNMAAHRPAWRYLLQERGLTTEGIWHFNLGFCRRGRHKGYVIFPVLMDGTLVYWQGRATWDPPKHFTREQRKQWEKDTYYRKTLNPYAREGFATSGDVLFNYDAARVVEHVVIVEGPIDAMKVGVHAVALLGKAINPVKVERLLRMHARRYTIYLDRGAEEAEKALKLARELNAFAPVSITVPPEGHDAGSLTREQNAAVIAAGVSFRDHGLTSGLKVT